MNQASELSLSERILQELTARTGRKAGDVARALDVDRRDVGWRRPDGTPLKFLGFLVSRDEIASTVFALPH